MAALKRAGGQVERDPQQQFLVDLYNEVEAHFKKGRYLVVGGGFNMAWEEKTGETAPQGEGAAFKGLRQWAEALNMAHSARARGWGGVKAWVKSCREGAPETELDHILASANIVSMGALNAVNDSDHRPVLVELRVG